MPNENCLEGMKCPKCGGEGPFGIGCDVVMLVTDEGTSDQIGDTHWDEDSYCECRECLKSGTVKDFQVQDVTPVPPAENYIKDEYLGDGVYVKSTNFGIVLDLRGQDDFTFISLGEKEFDALVKFGNKAFEKPNTVAPD